MAFLRNKTKRLLFALTVGVFVVVPLSFVFAQDTYIPLTDIGAPTDSQGSVTFATYLPFLFQLFIGVAAGLAVIYIIIGGLRYMTTEAVSGKEGAKEMIRNAIWGLVLAIISFLILITINPELLNFSPPGSSIDLEAEEAPIEITLVSSSGGEVGEPFEMIFQASGGFGAPILQESDSNPFANSNSFTLSRLGQQTLKLSGIPSEPCTGCTIQLMAVSSSGRKEYKFFDIEITSDFIVLSEQSREIELLSWYTFSTSIEGGRHPITVTLPPQSALPNFVRIEYKEKDFFGKTNPTISIQAFPDGRESNIGTYTIPITIRDSAGTETQTSYTLKVVAPQLRLHMKNSTKSGRYYHGLELERCLLCSNIQTYIGPRGGYGNQTKCEDDFRANEGDLVSFLPVPWRIGGTQGVEDYDYNGCVTP